LIRKSWANDDVLESHVLTPKVRTVDDRLVHFNRYVGY
jgi:hypothetical protein